MGIGDIVAITIALTNAASPTIQAFGVPMLAAQLSANAVSHNPARFRVYSSGSALASMVTDGILTTDPVFREMEVALSQPNVPPQIALGRRTNLTTQVLKMTFTDATTVNPYGVTVIGYDGVSHTYGPLTSTGVPATDAATFAALVTATNIGTVTVSGPTITITQASGKLTDLRGWTPNINIADTTADPGIAADLVAINTANNLGWYGGALDSNSKAEIAAAQAWFEATGPGGKFAFYNNADAANDTAGSGDLNSGLQTLGYQRCYLQQSNSAVLSAAGLGLGSQLLALFPGSYNPAFKAIPGVPADTDQTMTETQQLVLNTMSTSSPGVGGKAGNWYKTVSGLNITWPGCAPGGRFIDLTIFLDWFQVNAQADLFAVEAGLPKVPYTDFGTSLLGSKLESRIKIGGSPPYGGVDLTQPFGVVVPPVSTISQTDKTNRNFPGMTAFFTYSGAIDTTEVGVTVVP